MIAIYLRERVAEFAKLFESFESLLVYRKKLGMGSDQLAINLCELYATWGAHQIRCCLGSSNEYEAALRERKYEQSLGSRGRLPEHAVIQRAAQDLLHAITSQDKAATSDAISRMQVSFFCPEPERVFSKMEEVASDVSGIAKQVFWVDLSLFSASVGDYERAKNYCEQTRTFDPTSRELYDTCVIEGLIALNGGSLAEAVRCLDSSIRACQADVDSSLQCSLRAPNLDLAEKLLELGERVAVVNHLLECRNVWQLRSPQIEGWIHDIENGYKPNFQSTDPLAYRLNVQWIRSCSLEMGLPSTRLGKPMDSTQVLIERERQESEFEHIMDKCVMEELEYLENYLVDDSDNSGPVE